MTTKLWAWIIGVGIVLGSIWGAIQWHDSKKEALYKAGFDAGAAEVQSKWDSAVNSAKEVQSGMNDAATTTQAEETQTAKTIYIERIKEVTRYAPAQNTSCPVDADFVRLFNDGGTEAPASGSENQ